MNSLLWLPVVAVTAISLASLTKPRTPLISLTLLIFSGTVSAASKSLTNA